MSNQPTTKSPTDEHECSVMRLHQIILKQYPEHFMVFVDMFSLGCLLHIKGDTDAGLKVINQVLGAVPERGNKLYFESIRKNLPGNEIRFNLEIQPHYEIKELFKEYLSAARPNTTGATEKA
ncbi:hypothetical protein [Undibacterium crateris]|uniref:hypothetical protein n=1 Tax=Undibacterium crateris TaxID=2528175 RepID=UPI00138962CF|nr:hypothetical protein [Undibacterium crateris]NDI85075.1 hypothetical protein [Undibacterium crateris]